MATANQRLLLHQRIKYTAIAQFFCTQLNFKNMELWIVVTLQDYENSRATVHSQIHKVEQTFYLRIRTSDSGNRNDTATFLTKPLLFFLVKPANNM
jgi:hypothetical protein